MASSLRLNAVGAADVVGEVDVAFVAFVALVALVADAVDAADAVEDLVETIEVAIQQERPLEMPDPTGKTFRNVLYLISQRLGLF